MIILDIDKPERCGKCPMHHDGNDYCKLAHDHASFVRAKGCPIQTIKTGHWKSFTHSAYHGIDDDGEPIWREVKVYHCNLCNRRTVIKENYCPNCGCRMVEPQESEE